MMDSKNIGRCTALVVVLTVASFGCSGVSAGEVSGEDPPGKDESAVIETLRITCPRNLTATWIGAANGRTNSISGLMEVLGFAFGTPTANLGCVLAHPGSTKITQVVMLQPHSVPSACGGSATITGSALTSGHIPPFGGFPMKSQRTQATPTYNEATGRCQLDIPLAPTNISVKVSEKCKPRSNVNDSWDCPGLTHPI